MGFDYHYIEAGHDLDSLIETFSRVKDLDQPVVIHMRTLKGRGYQQAKLDKENFHYVAPFNIETGKPLQTQTTESYAEITGDFLCKKAAHDKHVVGITAGTPGPVGFNRFRYQFKEQFMDVGIAEEHAIALASGIASQGGKPVVSIFSTFIQSAYDQLSQDLAINGNSALILVHGGGITGTDVTHLGVFDIPLISNIPNIVYLAPTSKEEYLAMMEWGLEQTKHPVAIRVPGHGVVSRKERVAADFFPLNQYQRVNRGSQVAIIALGTFYALGERVQAKLKEELGIKATLINPRFIAGIDVGLLTALQDDHQVVITLEDGVLDGGFGEKITRFYGNTAIQVQNFGAAKEFTDRV